MFVNKFIFRNLNKCNLRLFTTSQWNHEINTHVNTSDTYYKQQGLKQDEGKPIDWDSALPYEAIPGPKPLPVLGNIHHFLFGKYANLDFLDLYHRLHEDYGKIAIVRALPTRKPMIMLYDPDDMEKLVRNEGIWPFREITPSFSEYRTKLRKEFYDSAPGILIVHGESWFNTRTKVNPILMQPRTVKNYTDGVNAVTTDMVKIIKRLSTENANNIMPKNFESYIQNCALESVGYISLNRKFGCLSNNPSKEARDIIDSSARIFENLFKLDFLPIGIIMRKFNTKTWKIFIKDMDYLTNVVKKYIDEAIVEMQNKKDTQSNSEQSILEKLLAVNEKVAITMVIDMILAGVDTTTKSIGNALYYLAKNKESQSKLQEELRTIMPNPDSPLTREGLEEAKYLRAVIKESMRLSPVAIGNLRTSTKEMVLGGYQIPKGVDIIGANAVMSRSEDNYERPNEFIPERWLRSTTNELSHKNASPFATLPFGVGPRSCVGQRVANLVLQVFIGKVIRNFTMDWPHKDMRYITALTNGCADPLEFKMVPVSH